MPKHHRTKSKKLSSLDKTFYFYQIIKKQEVREDLLTLLQEGRVKEIIRRCRNLLDSFYEADLSRVAESAVSLEEENRYSSEKGSKAEMANKLSEAQKYFQEYKSITREYAIEEGLIYNLDRIGVPMENPSYAARETRSILIDRAIEELLPSKKEVLGELFSLILLDPTVDDENTEMSDSDDSRSLMNCLKAIANCDEHFYFEYLSKQLVSLFEDESLSTHTARRFALIRMESRHDKAIVTIVKRIYDDSSHELHYLAKNIMRCGAITRFPDCFLESKYDEIRNSALSHAKVFS